MTVLAIATSTSQVGVAISGPDGIVAALRLIRRSRHGETLAPAIDSLAHLSGVELTDVSLVAVDVGPGLFTGLRVGVATAKAMASALGVPIAGCGSLKLLAHPHRRDGRTVASVVDARRGEVFWALYERCGDSMVELAPPSVSPPDVLARELAGASTRRGGLLVTGDGARRYESVLTSEAPIEVAPSEFDHPSAEVLAALAPALPAVPPDVVVPNYMRGADVRIGWEQRGA